MSAQLKWLQLYRSYLTLTKECPDRSLKLYIRRRAEEDIRSTVQMTPSIA
jgi:hypothetical protein